MSYSLDLRKRIVAAVERGVETKRAIAALFGVHESFIYKLLRQQRERGDLAPLPHGGGASAKLTDADLLLLFDLVAATPDATLAELGQQLQKKTRLKVSQSTICRGLQTLTLTVKKDQARRRSRPGGTGSFPPNAKDAAHRVAGLSGRICQ